MKKRETICLAALIPPLLLFFAGNLYAEPMRVAENLRSGAVLVPLSTPNKSQLTPVSFITLSSDAEIVGALILYDDPQTKRPVDYLELYDGSGGLLLITWVDRFGIRRTAVDRGLLDREAPELEGVLILLPEGIPS